jgi:hypothetical protein
MIIAMKQRTIKGLFKWKIDVLIMLSKEELKVRVFIGSVVPSGKQLAIGLPKRLNVGTLKHLNV